MHFVTDTTSVGSGSPLLLSPGPWLLSSLQLSLYLLDQVLSSSGLQGGVREGGRGDHVGS